MYSMYSKYRGICKGLGIAVLVLGIIGSIAMANQYGVRTSYSDYFGVKTERDALLTVAYFISGCFGTSVMCVILMGLSEVLEFLEEIWKKNETISHEKKETNELPPL